MLQLPNSNSTHNPCYRERNLIYLRRTSASDTFISKIRSEGWYVHTASDTAQVRKLRERYDLPVGLIHLETITKQEIYDLEELCATASTTSQWIALVSRASLQHLYTRRLINKCFFDFHTLPIDIPRLLITLGHALGVANLQCESSQFKNEKFNDFQVIGKSDAMQKLLCNIDKLCCSNAPILISGESGTGKELAACAIHAKSQRSTAPFVKVRCASVMPNLIQAELFGFDAGAFTGANQYRIGRIEAATGGTVFLDDIGNLPYELQGSLLHFLQEKTIERVGGNESIPVDTRIIAASATDLEKEIAKGRFRDDLYYRLNVFRMHIPPLRDRVEDIELLANFFFEKFSHEKTNHVKGFSQQALDNMCLYSWPGNVRELMNRIHQALILSENKLITPADLGLERLGVPGTLTTLEQARLMAEKEAIHTALRYTRHNLTQAAQKLGISRMTLHRLVAKHGIDQSKLYG